MAQRKLEVVFLGDAGGLKTTTDEVAGKLDGLSGKLGSIGKAAAIGFGAVGAAGLGAAAGLFKIGESFDGAFDAIAVGTGATGAALDGLEADFKKVFTGVPTDMGSASTAIADLNTRLGLSGEALQKAGKSALELSRITGTDVAKNIENAAAVTENWNLSNDKAAGVMDKLFIANWATVATSGIGAELVCVSADDPGNGPHVRARSDAVRGVTRPVTGTGIARRPTVRGTYPRAGRMTWVACRIVHPNATLRTPQDYGARQMRQSEILEAIECERARLRGAVDGFGDGAATVVVTAEGWTAKDVLAHCIYWTTLMARELGAESDQPTYARGASDELTEDDWNALTVDFYRSLDLIEIRRDFDRASMLLEERIRLLDDIAMAATDVVPRVPGQALWQVIGGESFLHWSRHAADLERTVLDVAT